jgi:mRNA-degrading endonuclease toxin of MazEF toxin-antitoxin module
LVIVAAPGDYGKPRPAVIVQSNAIPESHASVVIRPSAESGSGAGSASSGPRISHG